MERAEISYQEVQIFRHLFSTPKAWFSNQELAKALKISPRTVRAHTLRFVKAGIAEQMKLYPGYRYRWSSNINDANSSYLNNLRQAMAAFGGSSHIKAR